MRKSFILVAIILLGLTPSLFAGISVRAGLLMPQSDFKAYAGNAWSVEIVADVSPFSVPFLSVPVMVNAAGFGEKQADWEFSSGGSATVYTQTSSLNLTGGGIGLKLEPAVPGIKPFVEVFGRLASIEQDYHPGIPDAGNTIESKTKFGYQIDGGLKYSVAPTASLLVGASYVTFLNASLTSDDNAGEIDASMIGIFVGLNFSVGW